jgi:iron uptake system component EfeO
VADTLDLQTRVAATELKPAQLGIGAKELLDEVATGKVTGEEERYSHTDLWDFQANIDGARVAYEALRPALQANDAELDTTLASRFTSLQALLDRYRDGDGFVLYTALTPAPGQGARHRRRRLGEPLAGLTAAVVR